MMRYLTLLIIISSTIFSCKVESEQKPNIIYILADDLGYGELGTYGQKIIETAPG